MSVVITCGTCRGVIIVRDASLVAGAFARPCPLCGVVIRGAVV